MKKIAGLVGLAALLQASAAQAIDFPEVQEGLWQRHWTSTSSPGGKKDDSTESMCHSHAQEKQAQALARSVKGCNYVNESLVSGKYSVEIQCTIGTTKLATKATAQFKDTAVHSESVTNYDPPMGGVSSQTDVIDEKFVGACPAGMNPGDRLLPDGSIRRGHK